MDVISGIISCHPRSFEGTPTGAQGPNTRQEYKMLLVPVTGISKPGNSREYPGPWQKGRTPVAEETCNPFVTPARRS